MTFVRRNRAVIPAVAALLLTSFQALAGPGGSTHQMVVTDATLVGTDLTINVILGPDEPVVTLGGLPVDVTFASDAQVVVDARADRNSKRPAGAPMLAPAGPPGHRRGPVPGSWASARPATERGTVSSSVERRDG